MFFDHLDERNTTVKFIPRFGEVYKIGFSRLLLYDFPKVAFSPAEPQIGHSTYVFQLSRGCGGQYVF